MSPLPFHQRIDLRRRVANAGVRPDADFYRPQEARILPTDHRGLGETGKFGYLAPTEQKRLDLLGRPGQERRYF